MEGYKKTSISMVVIALLAMVAIPAMGAKPRYLPHPAGHLPKIPVRHVEPVACLEPVVKAEELDPAGCVCNIIDGAFAMVGDILEAIFRPCPAPLVSQDIEQEEKHYVRRNYGYSVRHPSGTGRWVYK